MEPPRRMAATFQPVLPTDTTSFLSCPLPACSVSNGEISSDPEPPGRQLIVQLITSVHINDALTPIATSGV